MVASFRPQQVACLDLDKSQNTMNLLYMQVFLYLFFTTMKNSIGFYNFKTTTSQTDTNSGKGSSFREKTTGANRQSFALELVPGNICELKCECCYKQDGNSPKNNGAIPYQNATDYIAQANQEGFKEAVLIGGEPTLHPQIFDIIQKTRELGMTPILATNGITLAKEDHAKKLEGQNVVLVTHAYFPGGEEIIDRFSGKNGYAETLKKAISNIRSIPDIKLVLEMPLTDSLFPHAFTFFRYCREQNITPFIEISRSSDQGSQTSGITPEAIAELFRQCQEYDQQYFPDLVDEKITPPSYGNKCTMSITGLHVKNLGNGDFGGVYSCCAQKIRHGDLRKQPLRQILQNPTLTIFADQDKYIVGPCRDCQQYNICKGGCRGEAYLKFGCPRASSPACHLIPPEIRHDPKIMAPKSCNDCPAENCPDCNLGKKKLPIL